MAKNWWDQVPCPECGMEYTRRGLSSHRFTRRCEQNAEISGIRDEIRVLENTVLLGKQRATKTFADALDRRELRELTGTVCECTRVVYDQDGYYFRTQEYWVDHWVAEFYKAYLVNKRLKIYDDLVRIKALPVEDRDKHVQMLLLKYVDIDG